PARFKQDTRYYPSHKRGFGARAAYAASRGSVTRSEKGQSGPNYAWRGGKRSADALANIWERKTPGHTRIGVRPTFTLFGTGIGLQMLSNIVFREFWPDIRKKLGKK